MTKIKVEREKILSHSPIITIENKGFEIFSQRPKIKSLLADFFFTDKVCQKSRFLIYPHDVLSVKRGQTKANLFDSQRFEVHNTTTSKIRQI